MTHEKHPFETGLILEPKAWRHAHFPARSGDEDGVGKVDFDDEEGGAHFTVQVVLNDPVPPSGALYTLRVWSPLGSSVNVVYPDALECLNCGEEALGLNSSGECSRCSWQGLKR